MGIIGRMTKSMGLLVTALLWCVAMMAGEVTEQQALQKAQRFMQSKQFVSGKSLRRASQQGVDSPAYYIFNAENNGGFVIVSADDRTEEILGYSEQGGIDVDNMPENLRVWLDGYTQEIKSLPTTAKATRRASAVREEIPVLVKSQWGQDEPFNWRTPTYTNDKGETVHYVTGCVATAMAQLMYYHRWPETSLPVPAYTTYTLQINMPELPSTTFLWDKMLDVYSSGYSEEAGNAVADLMLYCGQSVEMDYDVDGSGASTAYGAQQMNRIFGYSAAIHEIYRSNFTTAEWENFIYGELSAQRPVLYSGDSSTSGGHAFICDGYKEGMYHFNLGWGEGSNGYYVISAYSEIEFNLGQSAVIGIEPDRGQAVNPSLIVAMRSNLEESSRTTETADFIVDIDTWFYNYITDFTGQWALALYQNGSLEKVLESWSSTIKAGQQPWYNLTNLGNLADGTYTIRGLYRQIETSDWQPCNGPELTVVVSGLKMTILPGGTMDLTVNSCELLGKKTLGRESKLKLNITNNGTSKTQELVLYLDEQEYSRQSVNVDPGATEDVLIPFVAMAAGEIKVKVVCTDNATDPLWQGTVTITEALEQNLTGSITVGGEFSGTIPGTDIHGTVTINNSGSNNYNDDVEVWVYNNDTGTYVTSITLADVQVEAGESKEVRFDITGLAKGNYYIRMLYYTGNSKTLLGYTVIRVGYTPREYALTANISGMKLKDGKLTVHIPITNTNSYEYDDNIELVLYRLNTEDNKYRPFYYNAIEKTIEAGGTETLVLTCDGITDGDDLLLIANYISNGNNTEAYREFFTAKTSVDGDANGDGKISITDAVGVVNYILGNPSDNFNTAVGDVNNDGKITITDAVAVVNIILGGGDAASARPQVVEEGE